MSKWLKITFFAILLIGAGYFFGTISKEIGLAYMLILTPSKELLILLLKFLLAASVFVVGAGLVAALFRPVWIGFIAFSLAGLAMLFGWQMTPEHGFVVLVYLVTAFLYTTGVARGMDERIRFSVRPISEGQTTLIMGLIFVVCGSIFFSFKTHVDREGFSIPEAYIEIFKQQMARQIEDRMPMEEVQGAMAQFEMEFSRSVEEYSERMLKPYERFIPIGLAAGIFMSLVTITKLLTWLPAIVLSFVFRLLQVAGVTKVLRETEEVQRLVI